MLQTFQICRSLSRSLLRTKLILQRIDVEGKYFGHYSIVDDPYKVLKSDPVPFHITAPSYVTGEALIQAPSFPEVKEEWQIFCMKRACFIARTILDIVGQNIMMGITTEDIDQIVRQAAFERDSYPSPLNYKGFPKSCCTSVNNVACHGIPDMRSLADGDIVSVDVTVFHQGFHGDCCETFLVGNVDDRGKHLVNTAKRCRDEAVSICAPGVPFSEIGNVVENIAMEQGLCVVPAFIGHGIGEYFHGPPDIYHCFNNYPGVMKAGMTFTVEPIIAQGTPDVVVLEDGWTAVMEDNGRAAQFEHTLLITKEGREILTKIADSSDDLD